VNSTRRLIGVALAIIVALLGASSVMASGGAAPLLQGGAPGQLNYQGLLLDPATGDPVADGNYTLTFAIYDDATSTDPGHRLWNETQTVSVQDGLFNVILGAVTPITATWLDGRDLWLGITVQGESEMTPRTQLVSMPYALNAKDVRGTDIHPDYVYAGNGVEVASAGADGVYVDMAGSPSAASSSSDPNGFEVAGAEGDGLSVGRADNVGVRVVSAGDDGVCVHRAGNPSTTSASTGHHGFEVGGAQGNGLYVGQADADGVFVNSTGDDGVQVQWAGDDGVEVYSAVSDGVYVYAAGNDGVYVRGAGNPSTTSASTSYNGFEVGGAQGDGLNVGRADDNGVYVGSAGYDGVQVDSAVGDGVQVTSAGYGVAVISVVSDGVWVGYAGRDGVYVDSAGRYAGNFNGDVRVTGNLSKGGGSFKIDHPLDPQNRYLYHSFVESPDMMNVYNGNVTLDASGEAWVELPTWFEALNRDYRYQLTPIGTPGPNLYIAQKIRDNRFQIAGGTSGMEVSWQVTGIRHDPYAEAHRIPVEEDKPPEERGTYIHPKAYGQSETMGLDYKEAQARGYDLPVPER
jgi:hypothetical protein